MSLSISAARQDLLSSLDAYRNALHSGNSADSGNAVGSSDGVGGGNAAGAACGVDDADKPSDDVDASQDSQDDDPRNTQSTTQSDELQEMLQLMKMFMDALIQQSQQPDDSYSPDDGFSPVSSPSGGGNAPAGQAQASATPPPSDAGAAPAVGVGGGGGAAPAVGQAPAASDAGSAPEAPAAPASASGSAPVGNGSTVEGLSKNAQTTALSEGQSKQVAGQWKQNLEKDFGLTNDQAAGVVGNLWHESGGMNSGITQGGKIGEPNGNLADDNGNGYGIAQWGGARKQALVDYADKNDEARSSEAADYGELKEELMHGYAGAIDAVKGTGDVASATAAFANTFEKPSDAQMASRVADAEKVT